MKQELALQKIAAIVDRQKHGQYRELIYFLRDLKAKNVFNFSRSGLYARLAKSKRFLELRKQLNSDLDGVDTRNQYFDLNKQ